MSTEFMNDFFYQSFHFFRIAPINGSGQIKIKHLLRQSIIKQRSIRRINDIFPFAQYTQHTVLQNITHQLQCKTIPQRGLVIATEYIIEYSLRIIFIRECFDIRFSGQLEWFVRKGQSRLYFFHTGKSSGQQLLNAVRIKLTGHDEHRLRGIGI